MIYDTLSKGEDGLYHSRALNDEKKRYFIQLNEVTVSDVDQETGEVSFEVSGEDNQAKVEAVHVTNLQSALENSKTWFGKELPEKTISGAYTMSENIETDRISATRIFDHNRESLEFSSVNVGMKCTVLVEFSGLWFAKKAFGFKKIHALDSPKWCKGAQAKCLFTVSLHFERLGFQSQNLLPRFPSGPSSILTFRRTR